ncbi:MAG: winged helix-turn-helix domain-containing protein [Steroidobacteraceae bacterium]|nr:winged helix-turn-helix domain-containing protein [Steroidobacteraceae bacterium]
MEGQRQTTFRFDGWTVNRDSGDLARGEHATRLQIQPLQIFVELLENPGEVVTRERLIAKLWPTGIVEFDASLNTAVRKLRIALNDDPEKPRYIETIPRRGYRFIGKIEREEAPPSAPTALGLIPPAALIPATTPTPPPAFAPTPAPLATALRHRRWPVAAAIALVLMILIGAVTYWFSPRNDVPPVLAILPFIDIGPEQKDAALCLTIAEELGIRLAQLPRVRMVATTSTSSFAGKPGDVREIGRSLGATHVVEGTVRRNGEDVRVSVRLISVADGIPVFQQPYEFTQSTLRDIHETLSQSVAQELKLLLSPQQLKRWQARMTRDPEAYDYYIRARDYSRRKTTDGDDQAAELYRLAIERDPEFALAYVGLAEIKLGSLSMREARLADIAGEVKALLAKAEKLNPDDAELHSLKGWLATEEERYSEAESYLRRSLQLNPSDATTYRRLGHLFESLGRPREALEQHTRAAELDPRDFVNPMYRCMVLQDLGQFAEAARACTRARDLDSTNYWPSMVTSWLEVSRGDLFEALRWSEAASKLDPNEGRIVFHSIDLMLSLRLVSEARATARTMVTPDEARVRLYQASIELAEHGPAGLRTYLRESGTAALTESGIANQAVRLYQIAGELDNARAALESMRSTAAFADRELFDPSQIRAAHAPSLVFAGLLLAQGERAEGLELLDKLDQMLDRAEKNGVVHFGLDSLRAESLALRGKPDDAMRSLRRAVTRGWREAWRAETGPYLASLRERDDFKALIREVEARNDEMRARFHQLKRPT